MEHRKIVVVVLFFFLCGSAFGGEKELAWDKDKFIDLFDLISMYLIPASWQDTVPGWQTGAEPGSPIRWETDGIEWVDTRNAHIRTGEVIVTISGEPIHILRKYWEPNPWRITVVGPRAGIIRMEISSQINSQELQLRSSGRRDGEAPDSISDRQVRSARCGKRRGKVILHPVPGKHPAWLHHQWSCGSAGCSSFLTVFLFRKDADALSGLVPSCGGGNQRIE